MHHNSLRSFTAAMLIALVIAAQLMIPVTAYAGLKTVSATTQKIFDWETLKTLDFWKKVAEVAVRAAVRQALVATTQQVVNWISADGGNKVGFIGNFEQGLQNELDDRAGEFLAQLPGIDFCGDIGAYLRLNLRVGAGGLRQRAKCSLTSVVKNVQNFYDNFQNGGWEAFLKANVDIQNNTAGAFLIALDAKSAIENKKAEQYRNKTAKGDITGVRIKVGSSTECVPQPDVCPAEEECSPQPPKCITEDLTQTPGETIAAALNAANVTGINLGISAKWVDEAIVVPIISALLKRTIQSAHGIFGRSPNTNISYNDPGLFDGYKEIEPLKDRARTRTATADYLISGTLQTAANQTLAARKELASSPAPGRKLELAQKTESLLGKTQLLLTEQSVMTNTKLASFYIMTESDITATDEQISQTLNRVEPIAAELGSSPSASPTGNLKTDTLASIAGSRTQLASQVLLVRQAIQEVTAAIGGLSTTSIMANQTPFITQANALSAKVSALAGNTSAEQSRVSTLRQRLLSSDAVRLIDELKPKQDNVMSSAEQISTDLNDFAGALTRDQDQISALKAQLVNPADGALIDNIVVQAASIIAEVRQLAAEISKLSADISAEQTQTNALQEKLQAPEAVRLIGRLGPQANIITEGDRINAEISSLTDTVAEGKAQVGVLRQQLASAEAGRIIMEITTLTDTIANQRARVEVLRQQLVSAEAGRIIMEITTLTDAIAIGQASASVLRQQLVSAESGQLISQISQLTDIIADEQAQVSVLRQQLKTGTPAEISNRISELTDTIASEQAQVSVLRQQLSLTTDPATIQQIQAGITATLTDISAKQLQIGTLRLQINSTAATVNAQIATLLADIQSKQSQIGTLRLQINSTAATVNAQIATLLADIQSKQSQIGTLRRQLVAIGDSVNVQISNWLADILIKQTRISTLRMQLLAIGGAINTEIVQLLSDILLKQARIRVLREDLVTIRDLGRFATDIAAIQSRIIPVPDQIRDKSQKIIIDLKTKQTAIKSLMQRLLTQPKTDLEAQREARLENYMELLTSPNSSERGALESLQEASTGLRASGDRLAGVATVAEATGEIGSSIDAVKNASDVQQRAGQTLQVVFGFLDNLSNPDFIPQPAP